MARRDQYIKSKSDFVLRKKHAVTNVGTIYENDYMTIVPDDGMFNEDVAMYSDSNFKFRVRSDYNAKKRHFAGNWIGPQNGDSAWTGNNCSASSISSETKIVLKPDYSSLTDFAYFGSAQKLIEATVRDIILRYPGGICYLGSEVDPEDYFYVKEGNNYEVVDPSTITSATTGITTYYPLSNEFEMDVWTDGVSYESVDNPMRVLTASFDKYVYGTSGLPITSVQITRIGNNCPNTIIARTAIGSDSRTTNIFTYLDDEGNTTLLSPISGAVGEPIIRVNDMLFEQMYDALDDFEKVLLNRRTKPIFRAVFNTPYFDKDNGYFYRKEEYIWPSIAYSSTTANFYTPDLTSAKFSAYLSRLQNASIIHDEFDSDNIWRMLTHESLKNLDWTFKNNESGEVDDFESFDSSRLHAALELYGRQFDDLKRYADNIKHSNAITYDEKNNLPDYFLTDSVESDGWEAYHVAPLLSGVNATDVIFSGSSISGYTTSDANNSFMRRLALNSDYIQSLKGTKRGIETVLGLFGMESGTSTGCYSIKEYVAIATTFPSANSLYQVLPFTEGYYYGDDLLAKWPVVEVAYGAGEDDKYVIPWFDPSASYSSGIYFQGMGGWQKTDKKKINLQITTASAITNTDYGVYGGPFEIYGETFQHMKYAESIDELTGLTTTDLKKNTVCYVENIGDISTMGYNMSPADEALLQSFGVQDIPFSHYFILKNVNLAPNIGFVDNELYKCYGWRNVFTPEFDGTMGGSACTRDGAEVLYTESLKTMENGNNPHAGFGQYDSGKDYLRYFRQIFKYELDENLLLLSGNTADPAQAYTAISGIGFGNCTLSADSKCHVFFDTKDQRVLTLINGQFSGTGELIQTTSATDLDILTSRAEYSGYTIPSQETSAVNEKFDECAAFSVINVKNINIDFTIGGNEALREYIETVVMRYLEQMVPSTAIFSYTFDGNPLLDAEEPDEVLYEPYVPASPQSNENTSG